MGLREDLEYAIKKYLKKNKNKYDFINMTHVIQINKYFFIKGIILLTT